MVSDLLEEKEEFLREAEQLKQSIADLEKEVIVWKKASENNSYRALLSEDKYNKQKEINQELVEENESLKTQIKKMECLSEKRIAELEKENAELDCQKNRNKACYSCAKATERCFKNEIGCPCEKYKSYKYENAQLKNRNIELAGQKASLERWYGEAKELLREYIRINLLPPIERNFDDEVKLFEQAEQFLKDSEVKK